MSSVLIRAASRPFLDAAATGRTTRADSDRAVAALRSDVERWSRWGWGVLGFVLAVAGAFVAVGMAETVRMLGGITTPLDVVVIVIAAVVAVAGCTLLLALQRTGRRLLRAAAHWRRAGIDADSHRGAGSWIAARTVNLEPRVLARSATAALALLLAVFGIAIAVRDLTGPFTSFTVASAVVGIIAAAAGLGQAGGVMRIVSVVAEGDPLWVRLRSAFRREA